MSVLDSNSRGVIAPHRVNFLPRVHLFLLFRTSRGAIYTKLDFVTFFCLPIWLPVFVNLSFQVEIDLLWHHLTICTVKFHWIFLHT